MYINTKRVPYLDNGIAPRQRKVYVLRWNPSISPFTIDEFYETFAIFKDEKEGNLSEFNWTVWDWKTVEHRDLYVMMKVGTNCNGIVWAGYLHGFPYQYENEDGTKSRSHFFDTDFLFMQDIDKTGKLTADVLRREIPDVDWEHGHSGELLSVEQGEKLGRLILNELLSVENSAAFQYDDFEEKKYVLSDIVTFLCPKLKTELLNAGRNESSIQDINNLMIRFVDTDYESWDTPSEHMVLDKLNGIRV